MKYVIALLAFAGMVVSGMALRVHYQDPSQAPPCAVTEKFDCGAVNHSRFADFPPRGFDEDAFVAQVAYSCGYAGADRVCGDRVLCAVGTDLGGAGAGSVGFFFAAMLTYLEAFVLEKWCIYCLWSQGIVTTILLVTTGWWFGSGSRSGGFCRRLSNDGIRWES